MALLIAESGSTKTDWRLVKENGEIAQYKTLGINPFYQDSDEIFEDLSHNLWPKLTETVSQIFYYGTGMAGEEKIEIVEKAIKRLFPNATIELADDMVAAARALCLYEPGIACILGTGANSCFYDGQNISQQIKPLGFWLGDEGSGGYIGKILITKYLRNELPEEIEQKFKKKYGDLSRIEILDKAYKQPFPNRYFASFSKFIFDNRANAAMYLLVYEAFNLFIEKNILKYHDAKSYKINFTGSVAFYFSDVLRKAITSHGLSLGIVAENPIAGLVLYHTKTKS